jgi:prevent-host-death family protein
MTSVNIHQAKTHLSQLIAKVEGGEEVIIARDGKPVAKLVRMEPMAGGRAPFGFMKGEITISPDFDAPDPEIDRLFEDGPIEPIEPE